MKVLVTGGAGFIGRHLVDELLSQGARVTVVDIHNDPPLPSQVDFRHGSVTDQGTLNDAVQGQDWVFHLAANAQLWAPKKDAFDSVNHLGTRNIIKAIERLAVKPKRIICTATEAILIGHHTRIGSVVDERATLREAEMLGPYCVSKFRAEQTVVEAYQNGLPVISVYPTLPMGPGDVSMTPPTKMLRDYVSGVMPAFMDTIINIVDVRDCAHAHVLAAQTGKVGERYIFGGENVSMEEFLSRISALSGCNVPKHRVPYTIALIAAYIESGISALTGRFPNAPLTGVRIAGKKAWFDNKKAREELGFSPRALDETLSDAIAWLEQSGAMKS